jgi:hypothetical protein
MLPNNQLESNWSAGFQPAILRYFLTGRLDLISLAKLSRKAVFSATVERYDDRQD